MQKFFFIFLSVILFTSCSVHLGTISSGSVDKNVVYEDIAYGVSQTSHVVGIGGLKHDALVFEAKRNLINNRPLKYDEQYLNYSIDFKRTYWPFFTRTKAMVSADVVRFSNKPNEDPYTEKYKKLMSGKGLITNLFEIGDSIIYKLADATIIGIEKVDVVRILYKTKSDKYKSKRVSIDKIFTSHKSFNGLNIGEGYVYPTPKVTSFKEEDVQVYSIKALGVKSLLLIDHSKQVVEVKYQ